MALTRMPKRLASIASVREKTTIAAMPAPRIVSPGVGTLAASDAMLRITPPPRSRMCSSARRLISIGAITVARMVGSMSSSGIRCNGSGV